MLASFATGRQTSLVVDVGHEGTVGEPEPKPIPVVHVCLKRLATRPRPKLDNIQHAHSHALLQLPPKTASLSEAHASEGLLSGFERGRNGDAPACAPECDPPCHAVTAVQDGFALTKSTVRSPLGGQLLTRAMAASVEKRGSVIRPRLSFTRTETAPGVWEVDLLLSCISSFLSGRPLHGGHL